MAIYCRGARPNKPSEEILEAALGEEDENGVPFEIIKLKATRIEANYTSVHGCQDTFIEQESHIPGRTFTIYHRDEGRVRWLKGKFGGLPQAILAKTEKNLHFLASHFYDGIFVITDRVIKAEVEARAKKLQAAMSEKEKEKQATRIKEAHTHKEGGPLPARGGMTVEKIEQTEERKALDARKRELDEREQGIDQKEENLAKRVVDTTEAEIKVVHERGELEAMNMGQLKKLARGYYKLKFPETTKKAEILEMIFKPVAPAEEPVQQVTG
jgi:hypothetical protein